MNGESFIIAKAGKPIVKVSPIDTLPEGAERRLGSLKGMYRVTDDIKQPFRKEIEEMFYGKFERED